MSFAAPIPILRIFDQALARRFYADYLGFHWDWEHRFAPDMPLYVQVSRGACVLHLSEHHGDATPGSAVRVEVDDLDAYHAQLSAHPHPGARPGIEHQPWGMDEMRLTDPFGNRLIFYRETG